VSARYWEKGPDGTYRVARYVPSRLQAVLGLTVLRKSLGTKVEATALQRREAALAELQAQLDEAEAHAAKDSSDSRTETASRLRKAVDFTAGDSRLVPLHRGFDRLRARSLISTPGRSVLVILKPE
jgi:hypothetical protein